MSIEFFSILKHFSIFYVRTCFIYFLFNFPSLMKQTSTIEFYYKFVIVIPAINLVNNYVIKCKNGNLQEIKAYCHVMFIPSVQYCVHLYLGSEVEKKSTVFFCLAWFILLFH